MAVLAVMPEPLSACYHLFFAKYHVGEAH